MQYPYIDVNIFKTRYCVSIALTQLISYFGSVDIDVKILRMKRPTKAEPKIHGEKKVPKQFLMTETASDVLDKLAQKMGVTRSEYLERLVRVELTHPECLNQLIAKSSKKDLDRVKAS